MTKLEVQQRVLHKGKMIQLDEFEYDVGTRTFKSELSNLVFDFIDVDNFTFKTSSNCVFKTTSNCTFNTTFGCTFKTDSDCTFDTTYGCTFKTTSNCTFNTTFCCTFDTTSGCTFDTYNNCVFNTGYKSVLVRRGIFEVHKLPNKVLCKIQENVEGLIYSDTNPELFI